MVIYSTIYFDFFKFNSCVILTMICYRYIQFILITVGVYASRMWTVAIAATLLYLSSRSLDFVCNIQRWFYPIGWGYDEYFFFYI